GANCAPVECEITAGDDCDDSDGTVNPGSAEGCGNNEGGICGCSDCNSECTDSDGDGYSPDGGNCGAVDCNDDDGAVNPGATEGPVGDPTCSDGKDNNCDGKTDVADTQCTIVCVPSDEICDGLDNDCDGQVDEGVKNTYYKDADGDGYGDLADTVLSCDVPPGYVLDDTDCDDSDAQAYPGADEVCDGLDNDCDGSSDEDLTCDDPDLIVTYVGNVPAGKKRGGKFTIKERVTNEGGYAGSSSIVRYYLSKNKTRDSKDKRLKASRGGRLVSALAGGESSSGKVKLAIPEKTKPGRYYVLVCADDRDNVSESDESNNCKRSRKRIRIKK
ncbi:MAG: hypothetical protein JSU90_07905, partial [Nitrospiraceae bacterium]